MPREILSDMSMMPSAMLCAKAESRATNAMLMTLHSPTQMIYIKPHHHVIHSEQSKGLSLETVTPSHLPRAYFRLSIMPDTSVMYAITAERAMRLT